MQASKGKAVPPGSDALACDAEQKKNRPNFQAPLLFPPNLWLAANGLIFLEQSYGKMGQNFILAFFENSLRYHITFLGKFVQITTNLWPGENGLIFMQQSYGKMDQIFVLLKCEQPLRSYIMHLT